MKKENYWMLVTGWVKPRFKGSILYHYIVFQTQTELKLIIKLNDLFKFG